MPGIRLPRIVSENCPTSDIFIQESLPESRVFSKTPRSAVILRGNNNNNPYDLPAQEHLQTCYRHGFELKLSLWRNGRTHVCFAKILDSKLRQDERIRQYVMELGHGYCAVKLVDKFKLSGKGRSVQTLQTEMLLHQQLNHHPHIVKLISHFQSPSTFYIVLEFCPNGDLVDHINRASRWTGHGMPEDKARTLFLQALDAVKFCHDKGIAHRDIKLENILLGEQFQVKLADFGFAKNFRGGVRPKTPCGSRPYAAPELIFEKEASSYDATAVDVWSLGVILHAMVTGRLPYDVGTDPVYLHDDMFRQRLQFLESLSKDAEVLLRGMLQFATKRRMSLKDVLQSSWVTGVETTSPKPSHPLVVEGPSHRAMRNYAMHAFSTVPVGPGLERIQLKSRGGKPEVGLSQQLAWESLNPSRLTMNILGRGSQQRQKYRAATQQACKAITESQKRNQVQERTVSAKAANSKHEQYMPSTTNESRISDTRAAPSATTARSKVQQRSARGFRARLAPYDVTADTARIMTSEQAAISQVAAVNQSPTHDTHSAVSDRGVPPTRPQSPSRLSGSATIRQHSRAKTPSMPARCTSGEASNRHRAVESFDLNERDQTQTQSPDVQNTNCIISAFRPTLRIKSSRASGKQKTKINPACPGTGRPVTSAINTGDDSDVSPAPAASMADELLSISRVTLQNPSLLYTASGTQSSAKTQNLHHSHRPCNQTNSEHQNESANGHKTQSHTGNNKLKTNCVPRPPSSPKTDSSSWLVHRRTYTVSTLNPCDFFKPIKHES